VRVFSQIRFARLTRQLHAFANQRPGLRLIQAARRKARRRGLIAGGDRHLRPGAVIEVHFADKFRVFTSTLADHRLSARLQPRASSSVAIAPSSTTNGCFQGWR
jgi:hypothetical protein